MVQDFCCCHFVGGWGRHVSSTVEKPRPRRVMLSLAVNSLALVLGVMSCPRQAIAWSGGTNSSAIAAKTLPNSQVDQMQQQSTQRKSTNVPAPMDRPLGVCRRQYDAANKKSHRASEPAGGWEIGALTATQNAETNGSAPLRKRIVLDPLPIRQGNHQRMYGRVRFVSSRCL